MRFVYQLGKMSKHLRGILFVLFSIFRGFQTILRVLRAGVESDLDWIIYFFFLYSIDQFKLMS